MSPEHKLIAISAVCMGYAYFWVYPRMETITVVKILWRDAVVGIVALLIGGLMYANTQTPFHIPGFTVNWLIFQLIALSIIEALFFAWFAYKYDLDS